ncbi:MAG: glycosyl hydrolase, partial [Limisphaerales bacterium]
SYGDWAFCEGINRFVIHRYAFQPWTDPTRAPGMSMGPFGLHYERTETWWNQSKAWNEYLARCQYLLQQGAFVADVCYLAPETAPQHWKSPLLERERVGYSFDVCSPDTLMSRAKVSRNRLVFSDGMSYRVLVLPDEPTMTPELLSKIKALVQAGATVIGPRPVKSPSLSNFPRCDDQVRRLGDELWGNCDGVSVKEHHLGRGRIIWGKTTAEVLRESHVLPDFEPESAVGKQNLRYIHRRLLGGDVYFVANRSSQPVETIAAFRIDSKRPELWWPDTGRIDRLATYDTHSGSTRLPLRLEPFGSVFVLFPNDAKAEPDRITSIRRNGSVVVDLESQGVMLGSQASIGTPVGQGANSRLPSSEVDGTNTFTMAVWANPDIKIDLPPEADFGKGAFAAERNDALYPPAGHDVYHSPDHAGAGLSIGLNGVCVFEHTADYFAPTLVLAASLTNWTHVAVVYRQGRPGLYLNGRFVHEGLQSAMIVHSGVGVRHRRRSAPFQGALGEFFNTHRALSQSEIETLMREMPIPASVPDVPVTTERDSKGVLEAEAWQPGDYLATTARGKRWRFQIDELPGPIEISGEWQLRFPPNWGAPKEVTLDHLISWSEHENDGVKHFSGTATYTKSFDIPASWLRSDRRVYLDLGKVAVIADVRLNGESLGTLWKPPFRVDITHALKTGSN